MINELNYHLSNFLRWLCPYYFMFSHNDLTFIYQKLLKKCAIASLPCKRMMILKIIERIDNQEKKSRVVMILFIESYDIMLKSLHNDNM